MTRIRYLGKILPDYFKVTTQCHPCPTWNADELGFSGTCYVKIKDSLITVDVETDATERDQFDRITTTVVDLADATMSLISFSTAKGFLAVIETVSFDGGEPMHIVSADPQLEGLANSISRSEDFESVLRMVLLDGKLFLAIRDLADAIRSFHKGAINFSRAMDAICTHFIPEGGRREQGWKLMRTALNLSEAYVKSITELSKAPRHGNRHTKPDLGAVTAKVKAWKIMNRFLEYRKGGDRPLPLSEFPLLAD